jgi:separase
MGLSDLFRPPSQISLLETLQRLRENSPNFGDIIVGAILERQIDGIEGSSWKENVLDIVHKLLQDALLLYGDRWPIRRARILLRSLEFSYYAGPGKLGSQPEHLIEEIEKLLNRQVRCFFNWFFLTEYVIGLWGRRANLPVQGSVSCFCSSMDCFACPSVRTFAP